MYNPCSPVEIKFDQMSITPLNTIIIVTTTIMVKRHPLQNNSSKNAKCILPPFKIRSVVAAVAALCPLKSHQLCMSAQQSGETILSSTHKNVFLSSIWLKISILWRLSLFSSSYTWFDFSCSVRLRDPSYFKKRAHNACVRFIRFPSFLWERVDNDGKLSGNWIQLSRIDSILSEAERWKELY